MQQASQSLERMVWADDGSGRKVLTPESETVAVPVCPVVIDMDNGTPVTPDLYRFFKRGDEGQPLSLRRIWQPGTHPKRDRPFVYVDFNCTRFVRYTLDGITHYGDSSGCYVRHIKDATDPLWSGLTDNERARIMRAVRKASHDV